MIVQWIVDTRNLWPSAEKTAQLETAVCELLLLIVNSLLFTC